MIDDPTPTPEPVPDAIKCEYKACRHPGTCTIDSRICDRASRGDISELRDQMARAVKRLNRAVKATRQLSRPSPEPEPSITPLHKRGFVGEIMDGVRKKR